MSGGGYARNGNVTKKNSLKSFIQDDGKKGIELKEEINDIKKHIDNILERKEEKE